MEVKVQRIMNRGTALFREVRADHSIISYWVIACCDWRGDGVLNCPNLETASGVRTCSLRKSLKVDEFFRYLRRLLQWMISLATVVGAVFFCSGMRRIVLDGS